MTMHRGTRIARNQSAHDAPDAAEVKVNARIPRDSYTSVSFFFSILTLSLFSEIG